MSPPKSKLMGAPAFAVYNKHKNKHKSNKVNKFEDIITIESDIEEIPTRCTDPVMFNKEKKKRRRSATPFAVETNSSVEAANMNAKANTRRKRKSNDVMSNSDDNDMEVSNLLRKKPTASTEQHESFREKEPHRLLLISSERPDSSIGLNSGDYYASGDSTVDGRKVFGWIIAPLTPEEFFREHWEIKPLHVRLRNSKYFKTLVSTQAIDAMLRQNNVHFTENIDVTSYSNGVRKTLNPIGRAQPNVVWDFYQNGCSIRLLNPQIFLPSIRILNSNLQDYFTSSMGANVYLTPPNSQGFAPHYDDIEAFILQIEGQKHWKLYNPLTADQVLPRFSSGDFKQEDIGEPYAELTLQAGDLMYFPRGMIHQAFTVPGYHSLHLTISCYQRTTWGDLLDKLMPSAVQKAMDSDVEFREGLPVGYLNYMGLVHSDEKSPQRKDFIKKIKYLATKLIDRALIDGAVDQMGKQFIHDTLPPVLNKEERECTSFENGYEMEEDGQLSEKKDITLDTNVKLLKAHVLRVVMEEDEVRVYYNVDNDIEYHGKEPQFFVISQDVAPGVDHLVRSYPDYVKVSELPLETDDEKMSLAGDLWKYKLLATDEPL